MSSKFDLRHSAAHADDNNSSQSSYESVRRQIEEYRIGQFLDCDPEELSIALPSKIVLGFFGFTGHGKSCFINTLFRGVKDEATLRCRAKIGGHASHGTRNLARYVLTHNINLIDSVGFQTLDSNEIARALDAVSGLLPLGLLQASAANSSSSTSHLHLHHAFGSRADSHTRNLVDARGIEQHLAIVVVSITAKDSQLRSLADLLTLFDKKNIRYLVVVTKLDLERSEEKREEKLAALRDKLGIDDDDIMPMINYTSKESQRDKEGIDRLALEILAKALFLSEQNLQYQRVPQRVGTIRKMTEMLPQAKLRNALLMFLGLLGIVVGVIIVAYVVKSRSYLYFFEQQPQHEE
eukprot:GEZU01043641.1.p1 GENE.GEZU01043641.1~~GEZU01043641.1.p1  ORF type:complete len:351 (+),score=81.24 GEZU01043641.1:1-1053(+)